MATGKDYLTVHEFIATQSSLEQEAKELMPWDPKRCTYNMGSIRQQVFACRTHNNIGICYSCSIRCHTSCDIVELFTKRHFTCDCGTERDKRITKSDVIRCEIRKNRSNDIAALDNVYNHNFKGLFCDCDTEYDPDSPAVMLQCVMGLQCDEDWYHDYCIMGKDKNSVLRKENNTDEEVQEQSPEGFPSLDSFEAYICWKCISKYEYYFKQLSSHELSDELFSHKLPHMVKESKRDSNSSEVNSKKRLFQDVEKEENILSYSLFLKKDYHEVLEKIKASVLQSNEKLYIFLDKIIPFLLKDDRIYEPNEDEDEEVDIFSLTKNLLQSAGDRGNIAQNIAAFHSLKSKLNDFLKPFAESGDVVKEDDIKSFFQKTE